MLESVAYGNGKFVAVGDTRDFTSNAANKIYSTDGINWNKSAGATSTFDTYDSIVYGNGKFLTSSYSFGDILVSSDGYSWNLAYESLVAGEGHKVFVNGKFVIPLKGRTLMLTDGYSWDKNSNNITFVPNSVCYGNGKYVVVGDSGNLAYSTDGIVWTNIKMKNGFIQDSTTLNNICYTNGTYVVVGDDGNVRYSTDGANWSEKIVVGNNALYGICPVQ